MQRRQWSGQVEEPAIHMKHGGPRKKTVAARLEVRHVRKPGGQDFVHLGAQRSAEDAEASVSGRQGKVPYPHLSTVSMRFNFTCVPHASINRWRVGRRAV